MSEPLKLKPNDRWVLHNLERYGNCVCNSLLKKYKQKTFLEILKNEGYPCQLSIIQNTIDSTNNRKKKDITYIVSLEK